ncbi:MAG: flagellar hook-basal body complex protein FliE [Burkholderiaceae bacterium]|jgi:flagellar hook-basal body complex protein FliE
MIEKTGQAAGIADMMAQIRAFQAKTQGAAMPPNTAGGIQPAAPDFGGVIEGLSVNKPAPTKPTFGEVVKSSISNVNDLQQRSADLRAAYEKGENVPLTDVVLSMQKSSLAFEATLQIRNKVMKAYEDILNMPV